MIAGKTFFQRLKPRLNVTGCICDFRLQVIISEKSYYLFELTSKFKLLRLLVCLKQRGIKYFSLRWSAMGLLNHIVMFLLFYHFSTRKS